jgi:hypothetical protein
VFGPVNRRVNWKTWERCGENLDYQKNLIIKNLDNQTFHGLIINPFPSGTTP